MGALTGDDAPERAELGGAGSCGEPIRFWIRPPFRIASNRLDIFPTPGPAFATRPPFRTRPAGWDTCAGDSTRVGKARAVAVAGAEAELDGPGSGAKAVVTSRGREAAKDLVDALLLSCGGAGASVSE
jgi:hypothetical protein